MERYTYFKNMRWCIGPEDTPISGEWVNRLAAYENTGLSPEEAATIANCLSRIAANDENGYRTHELPWREVLKLSSRAFNCLNISDYAHATVRQLAILHKEEIWRIKRMGKVTQEEIASALKDLGFNGTAWETKIF